MANPSERRRAKFAGRIPKIEVGCAGTRQQAEAHVDKEGAARNSLTAMAEYMNTAAWRHRVAAVEAELRRTYVEAAPLEPAEDRPRRTPPSTAGSAPGRDALATDS